MIYTLRQPAPWGRWAILDDRGTEMCDGPYEQKEFGEKVVKLLNEGIFLHNSVIEAIKTNIIRELKKLPGSNGRRAEQIIRGMK